MTTRTSAADQLKSGVPHAPNGVTEPSAVASIRSGLNAVAALGSDWDGGSAVAIRADIVAAVRHWSERMPAEVWPSDRPAVVPGIAGTVQLEWHGPDGRCLELEFVEPNVVHYLRWHPAAETAEESTFAADDIGRAVGLIEWFNRG